MKRSKKKQEAVKELQSLINTKDLDIAKSDLSELFNNLIDNYKEFLTTFCPPILRTNGYCI